MDNNLGENEQDLKYFGNCFECFSNLNYLFLNFDGNKIG